MVLWVVFNAVPPTYSASMDQQGSAEDRASVATTHPTKLWEHFRREVRKRANAAGRCHLGRTSFDLPVYDQVREDFQHDLDRGFHRSHTQLRSHWQ